MKGKHLFLRYLQVKYFKTKALLQRRTIQNVKCPSRFESTLILVNHTLEQQPLHHKEIPKGRKSVKG
jgi:hypothetical protein